MREMTHVFFFFKKYEHTYIYSGRDGIGTTPSRPEVALCPVPVCPFPKIFGFGKGQC